MLELPFLFVVYYLKAIYKFYGVSRKFHELLPGQNVLDIQPSGGDSNKYPKYYCLP